MRLTVRTVAGRAFEVEFENKLSVAELKDRVAAEHGYDRASVKFVADGATVDDNSNAEQALATRKVVVVGKKQIVKAQQEEQKREREKPVEKAETPPAPKDVPSGPLNAQQISGLSQLQGLMEAKVRSMRDFVDILQYHGTVTDIRSMVQADQTTLAPILYQINHHAPKLLAAINEYQTEFLTILNEPVPVRPMTGETEDVDSADYRMVGDFMVDPYMLQAPPGHEVVYITREDDEAIQRLCTLAGVSQQVAAEAYVMCGKKEDLAASYLFDTLEQPASAEAPVEWVPEGVVAGGGRPEGGGRLENPSAGVVPAPAEAAPAVVPAPAESAESKAERKARRKRDKEAKQAEEYQYIKPTSTEAAPVECVPESAADERVEAAVTGVAATSVERVETRAERKARRKREKEAKQAEDYQYLKEQRIHVLYEQLVRQLLQQRPDQPVSFMLRYMQERERTDDTLEKGK